MPTTRTVSLPGAKLAQKKYAEHLRRMGSHGVSVQEVTMAGRKTYALIAMFERKPDTAVPKVLEVHSRGKVHKVPLKVQIVERFKPEW